MIGGYVEINTNGNNSTELIVIDEVSPTELPQPAAYPTTVAESVCGNMDGTIVSCGGFSNNYCYTYDWETSTWNQTGRNCRVIEGDSIVGIGVCI